MHRTAALLLLAVVAAPTAAAMPFAAVGVGPYGPTDGSEPYYLLANLSVPEPPHQANDADDCASEGAPWDAEASLRYTVEMALAGIFVPPSAWFPECVVVDTPCDFSCGAGPYASYDVEEGRYYVAPGGPLAGAFSSAAQTAFTGTTGVGLSADCEACPPPYTLG